MRHGPIPRAEREASVRLCERVTMHISIGLPRKEGEIAEPAIVDAMS